jgi:hypothetical protein
MSRHAVKRNSLLFRSTHQPLKSPLVLVRLDHVAVLIVNAHHDIMRPTAVLRIRLVPVSRFASHFNPDGVCGGR